MSLQVQMDIEDIADGPQTAELVIQTVQKVAYLVSGTKTQCNSVNSPLMRSMYFLYLYLWGAVYGLLLVSNLSASE